MDELIEYDLPEELIAQQPTKERAQSRLLILGRTSGEIEHANFADLTDRLRKGDLLVVNNTRVIPARLRARRPSGAAAEILLIEESSGSEWKVLLRPGKAGRQGRELSIEGDTSVRAIAIGRDEETFLLRFERDGSAMNADDVVALCNELGETPLPPYIHRDGENSTDRERYQTVYAKRAGAAAAPTAGLHFSDELLRELERRGVERTEVTLHVGLDTFKPLTEEQMASERLHGERVEISQECGDRILKAKDSDRRIIAVGTTTARALESFAASRRLPFQERTRLFIKPGYEFKLVDGLITNFHLPKSSLLLMVSAFSDRERILRAYREAIEKRYRFYSYGDAMFIA